MKSHSQILFYLVVIIAILNASCSKEQTNPESENDIIADINGYPIVGTNQQKYFDDFGEISQPDITSPFYGQDAFYPGNEPRYMDNGDGTITDLVTGLMWEQATNYLNWADAASAASSASTAGYSDWRVPTIKELYSLIDFTGNQGTGNPSSTTVPADAKPFINTDYFHFEYPATGRYIDVQYISQTTYTGTAIGNVNTFFGLNLADGRIKAYPQAGNLSNSEFPVRFVRGNSFYGINDFEDNGNGTISDHATGLMWSQIDSGDEQFGNEMLDFVHVDGSMNWEEALAFAENLVYAGYDDWRLPDAKELHSILDYTRSPDATNSPAINPIFSATVIVNEAGQADYPFYWTSTSFEPGSDAVMICFGRAMGYFDQNDPIGNSNPQFIDVHGAGCQRTDPKSGEPSYGFGPQGDVRRVFNFVRVVRDI